MMRVLLLIFSILHLHINTGVNGQAAGEHCGYYGSCDPYLVCEYPVCKNMIGRPCSSTSPCVHTSTCSGISETTCQCPGNSVPNHDNTLCVLKAGDGCSSGNSIKCMSGTSCENNVCKIEIGRPCLNTSLCVHISTCSGISETRCQCPDNTVPKYDYTVCELKAGEECSSSNSLNCTYGTTCENNVCKNKIGSPCSNTSSCVRTSTCSGISETTCQCPDNAVPNYDLTVCELNVGEECGNWNSLNCTIGTTCENNVCKLNIFERCEFGNETCVHLATCSNIYEMCVCPSNRYPTYDLTKCALTIGDMCETRDDVCLDIAVCRGVDEPTCECPSNTVNVGLHRCALKIGERCSEDDLCTHIATCKDTCQCPQNYVPSRNRGRCGLKLNETCSGYNICLDNAECSPLTGTCQCRANYTSTSDGTACSVNSVGLDGDCTSQACANGLTCENNVCMIDVEGSCAGINSTKCKTGLTCEADKCKQTLNGPCTTSTQCKTGLGCDIDKKCRKLVGQDCSGEEECVKNADCNTTCKCKTGFSQQGGMCYCRDLSVKKFPKCRERCNQMVAGNAQSRGVHRCTSPEDVDVVVPECHPSDAYKTTGSLFILAAALLLKSRLG